MLTTLYEIVLTGLSSSTYFIINKNNDKVEQLNTLNAAEKNETITENKETNNKNETSNGKGIEYSDKYKIYHDVLTYANVTNKELYKKLYDCIDNLEDTVDISNYSLNNDEAENLNRALFNRVNYELFYIKNIEISADRKKIKFSYNYPKETIKKMKARFNEKVSYILKTVIKPNYTDLQKELAIYKYINENVKYNYDMDKKIDEIDAYSIIVKGKGICLGYANAMYYLLDKVGIECYLATSDEPFHIWNIVKIDGEYYHLDATGEDGTRFGTGLDFFNMTDAERNKNGEFKKLWYGGNRNFKKLVSPKCTSNKFQFLRNFSNYYLDNNEIYYNDPKNIFKVNLDGTNNKQISAEHVNAMAMYNEWIYYTNQNDKNRLYKIKKDGTGKVKVDEIMNVFNLKIINDELIFKSDSINSDKPQEKKLKLK